MYATLMRLQPSPVVELNRAVAVAMADGPAEGLEIMERPEVAGPLQDYRWFHSAKADLLRRLERWDEAAQAYRAALDMAANASERKFLERRLAEVAGPANAQ